MMKQGAGLKAGWGPASQEQLQLAQGPCGHKNAAAAAAAAAAAVSHQSSGLGVVGSSN